MISLMGPLTCNEEESKQHANALACCKLATLHYRLFEGGIKASYGSGFHRDARQCVSICGNWPIPRIDYSTLSLAPQTGEVPCEIDPTSVSHARWGWLACRKCLALEFLHTKSLSPTPRRKRFREAGNAVALAHI